MAEENELQLIKGILLSLDAAKQYNEIEKVEVKRSGLTKS